MAPILANWLDNQMFVASGRNQMLRARKSGSLRCALMRKTIGLQPRVAGELIISATPCAGREGKLLLWMFVLS